MLMVFSSHVTICKVAIFECLQLFKRRGTTIKGENEAKAWKMLSPKCMSEEESDLDEISKEPVILVRSPGWRSEGAFGAHTHTHTHTHTYTHTHAHAHTQRTHTHTHTQTYLIYI